MRRSFENERNYAHEKASAVLHLKETTQKSPKPDAPDDAIETLSKSLIVPLLKKPGSCQRLSLSVSRKAV